MRLTLKNLLGPEDLDRVDAVLANGTFGDGAGSADGAARVVKRNLELDRARSAGADAIETIVHARLAGHPLVADNALPVRFSRPIFSRYEPGMGYGRHVDNPLLGDGGMRSDLSCTVFLSDPDSYDGGELAILRDDGGEDRIKLPRGDAIVYDTGVPHRVVEVTRGVRTAAVCWIQSLTGDPHRRHILARFHKVHHVMSERHPEAEETALFNEAYYQLFRLWARL